MVEAFEILREHGVQILTVGQYLRPTEHHLPVVRYWHPDEFDGAARRGARARLRVGRRRPAGPQLLPRRRIRSRGRRAARRLAAS